MFMNGIRRAIIISLLPLVSCLSVDAQKKENALEAYYFYSTACPGCANVASIIKELVMEIPIRGFINGNGDTETMPFEVRMADKATLTQYDVQKFPTLVVLKNGIVKQMFRGEQEIKDARVMLIAFRKGGWSVSEVLEQKPQNEYRVAGWIVSKGEYFDKPLFYLSDRRQTILIKSWLPLEAVQSPFRKTRPRLMSDVIGKPVFLEGVVTKTGDNLQFQVVRELNFE